MTMTLPPDDSAVEMEVRALVMDPVSKMPVVILHDRGQNRYLPIWIGPAEADAIAVRLQEVAVARPLTHDLLRSVIDALGAQINCVIVNDLANDTFYARLLLDVDGKSLEIDSRPSDAIALAVRAEVPIFADESVLEKAGVVMDKEGEKAMEGETVDPAELERMSAFKEFIETLDLDDFEKHKPPSSG